MANHYELLPDRPSSAAPTTENRGDASLVDCHTSSCESIASNRRTMSSRRPDQRFCHCENIDSIASP